MSSISRVKVIDWKGIFPKMLESILIEHNNDDYTEHKNLKAYIYIFNTFLYWMTEIEILISNIINNPASLIELLINSIKYNPTAWIVSIAILIVSVITFTYGCFTRKKDYIILTFFLLSIGTALTLLFYVPVLSGFKIEFIIEFLINSIKYNPTAWIVSIAILIVSVFTFTYGCLTSRKDYIILTFFLLSVGFSLTLLFYVSALSGFKIEFIKAMR